MTGYRKRQIEAAAFVVLMVALWLTGCGDDGGTDPGPLPGQFFDSAVEGLGYVSGGQSGVTYGEGWFEYEPGKGIEFSVGDIFIGSGPGDAVMTPVSLVGGAVDESHPTVINIARFLLTLDDDGDPANGITITKAARDSAEGMSLDFTMTTEEFGSDPEVLAVVQRLTRLTTAGRRSLVSSEEARQHLRATLMGILCGTYEGTYSGGDTGTWSIYVDPEGQIAGAGTSYDIGFFTITGTALSSGEANFIGGYVSAEAIFSGTPGA